MAQTYYYACNRCNVTFRSISEAPDFSTECANCGYKIFHEISKKDYDKARQARRGIDNLARPDDK